MWCRSAPLTKPNAYAYVDYVYYVDYVVFVPACSQTKAVDVAVTSNTVPVEICFLICGPGRCPANKLAQAGSGGLINLWCSLCVLQASFMISVTRQVLLMLDYLFLRFEHATKYGLQVPVRIQTTIEYDAKYDCMTMYRFQYDSNFHPQRLGGASDLEVRLHVDIIHVGFVRFQIQLRLKTCGAWSLTPISQRGREIVHEIVHELVAVQ